MELSEKNSIALGKALDIVLRNFTKLKGSKETALDTACNTVLLSVTENPSSVLGPICEQLTKSNNKKKRMPYLTVANWIHEKLMLEFDKYIIKLLTDFSKGKEDRRRAMGACILIRSSAIVSCASKIIDPLSQVISTFTSENPSLFEMEFFNTFVFCATAVNCQTDAIIPVINSYARWFQTNHPIAATAASCLLEEFSKNRDYSELLSKLRTDMVANTETIQQTWSFIAQKPFEDVKDWIILGLIIGRFDEERLRNEIANISKDKGQFSSIITVSLSTDNDSIRNIAKAIFRFGIHGRETAAFDPQSLSQILEQSDDLTGIALTFLSEMALANAKECLPQLFPLLNSDKPVARKNALALLQKVVDGHVGPEIRQMIAANLLPMIGDDAITVRVDIPKLFVGVPPQSIVPPLIRMLSDGSEKTRSTATASLKLMMQTSDQPQEILRIILDTALNPSPIPTTPGAVSLPSKQDEKSRERVFELVQNWAQESSGKMMLDPTPVIQRLWDDPQNPIITSFIAKAAPMYDSIRLLTCVITKLKQPAETVFDGLAPLLVLQSQSMDFFSRREVVGSQLFDLVFKHEDNELSNILHLRGDICARFPPSFVIPRILECGILNKFCLYIVCRQGMFHETKLKEAYDELLTKFDTIQEDLLIPVCDALFFSDRDRYIDLAMKQTQQKLFLMLSNGFQKFEEKDVVNFINKGYLDKLLSLEFEEKLNNQAVNTLFLFAYQARSVEALDNYWNQLFDIMSYFSDNKDANVRFSAIKLLGALMSHPSFQTHFLSVQNRIEHILTIHSDESEDPKVRELTQTFLNLTKPEPKIQEV